MIVTDVMRLLILATLGVAIVVWLGFFYRHREKRLYSVGLLLWLLNAFALMCASLFNASHGIPNAPIVLNTWSQAVYLQAGFSLIAARFAIATKDGR
jgi:drug/metabolite transporter (DMT)-like permease